MFNEFDRVVLTEKGAIELISRYSRLPVVESTKGLVMKVNRKIKMHYTDYEIFLEGLGTYLAYEDWIRRDGTLDRYRVEFITDGSLLKEDIWSTDAHSAQVDMSKKYNVQRILGVHLVEQGAK